MQKGLVIWLTGLPSAGKTTLAQALQTSLRNRGLRVEVLDGDEIRKNLSSDLGFSESDRGTQAKRVTYISKLLMRNGVIVIVSLVSPLRAHRDRARRSLERFIEIWARCSIGTCIKRDSKGLYGRALRGEITNMTGVQQRFEEPLDSDIIVDTEHETVQECINKILAKIKDLGYYDDIEVFESGRPSMV
jgi:adenylylsulfate kinase